MSSEYRLLLIVSVFTSDSVVKNAHSFNLLSFANSGISNITYDNLLEFSNITALTEGFKDIVKGARGDEGEKYLNTSQLIQENGYIAEEYNVTTADGYILTLFRIPGSGPAIFIMHGLPFSSDDFLTAGKNKALAYLLANSTYDVWLGNARGNKYSKRHVHLSPDSREFWDFTWNEIGIYDLPAMIDTVLEVSGRSDLIYIGHAQGTTVFFVLCSLKPEYNVKIRLYISLATITYIWHVKSLVARALIPFREQEYELSQALGLYELLPASPANVFLFSVVCTSSRVALLVCMTVLFNLLGFDYSQIDYNQLQIELSHFPSGSSFKQLVHYLQLAASRQFAQYDFGSDRNMQVYNQSTPPSYPVEKVTTKVFIFYADNDFLSVLQDVKLLVARLPNVVRLSRVPYRLFNHADYLWGKDVLQLVYMPILDVIHEFYESCNSISNLTCS